MEQIKVFIEKIGSDNELKAKVEALGEKAENTDEIITLAAQNGFTITADEITAFKNGNTFGELTEEDLGAVSGGNSKNRYDSTCKNMTKIKSDCVGFLWLRWCDHYRKELDKRSDVLGGDRYIHKCTKGAFPDYRGNSNGEHKPGNE